MVVGDLSVVIYDFVGTLGLRQYEQGQVLELATPELLCLDRDAEDCIPGLIGVLPRQIGGPSARPCDGARYEVLKCDPDSPATVQERQLQSQPSLSLSSNRGLPTA